MKTKLLPFIAGLVLLAPAQLRALDIDFYSDGTIEDGDVYDYVSVYDTPPDYTTVDMLGGSIRGMYSYDLSIMNMYAGDILWGISANDSSTVNIYGGALSLHYLGVYHSATLNIYGGDLHVINSPIFSESSTVNIYGYGFDYDGVRVLTGFLSDDSSFIFDECYPSEYAHLTLIPEPATLFLLALGALLTRNHLHKTTPNHNIIEFA
jgi:hypothetical protein